MIRVAIAEPNTITRWALREALARVPELEVVGEAGTVGDALALIERARPDLLLLDPLLPDHGGQDALAQVREVEAAPLILVLSSSTEPAFAARVIAGGAHGFVAMSADPAQLVEAIRAVSRGERVIPPRAEALVAAGERPPASMLTRRELQVMEMIARGITNREIAEALDVSVKTIDSHRNHTLKKLGLRNNADLTRFAVKHGYVAL